jgi:hypothetical protein
VHCVPSGPGPDGVRCRCAQDIRKNLGELDHAYIQKVHNKYAELEQDGWFDHVLDTSAPGPQVVENLLSALRQAAIIHGHDTHISSH